MIPLTELDKRFEEAYTATDNQLAFDFLDEFRRKTSSDFNDDNSTFRYFQLMKYLLEYKTNDLTLNEVKMRNTKNFQSFLNHSVPDGFHYFSLLYLSWQNSWSSSRAIPVSAQIDTAIENINKSPLFSSLVIEIACDFHTKIKAQSQPQESLPVKVLSSSSELSLTSSDAPESPYDRGTSSSCSSSFNSLQRNFMTYRLPLDQTTLLTSPSLSSLASVVLTKHLKKAKLPVHISSAQTKTAAKPEPFSIERRLRVLYKLHDTSQITLSESKLIAIYTEVHRELKLNNKYIGSIRTTMLFDNKFFIINNILSKSESDREGYIIHLENVDVMIKKLTNDSNPVIDEAITPSLF